jgi:hypothetical protein
MIGTLLSALAFAGGIYINGTPVEPDTLKGTRLADVDVSVDQYGNVHIIAPGYQVQVSGAAAASTASARPVIPSVLPGPPAAPAPSGVARARWWMATEDNTTSGHIIELHINGALVETVRSGEQVRIKDLGPYLKKGTNQIRMRAVSQSPTGGTLYVFVGTGADRNGTVHMDPPTVQFGVGSSRNGEYTREYTVQVTD